MLTLNSKNGNVFCSLSHSYFFIKLRAMKKKYFNAFIFSVSLSVPCLAQWNASSAVNTPVAAIYGHQKEVSLVADTKAGAIICWNDWRNNSFGDVYAQRLDYYGWPRWQANGVPVCTNLFEQSGVAMAEDGLGGAIIVWADYRNTANKSDIYAQRIDSSGTILWTADGVAVCSKANTQKAPKILGDGAGGAFIVWEDSVSFGMDIYAQKINSSGVAQWAANGVVVCSAVNYQINPKIQTDGSGGAIIVWQDKRNGSDYDILAQRLNAAGAAQWTSNGVFVASLTGSQINPKMRTDGAGGAIIGWQDKRNGSDYDIYLQRINGSGVGQWTNNGFGVCVSAGSQSAIDMTATGTPGEIIVTWKDDRLGNFDIYAQKVSAAGAAVWTANGLVVCNSSAPQINPNVVTDGSGGAIIVWQDSTATASDIYSQRITSSGAAAWAVNGLQVSSASDNQSAPKNVSNGVGGSIFAFEDGRNTFDDDIYAHQLDMNGAVGIKELHAGPQINSACFPNPFTTSAIIKISTQEQAPVQLKVYDALGKEVYVRSERIAEGFLIQRSGLQAGAYFYHLIQGNQLSGTGKIVILD
jgi:hypothetical protein